MQTTFKSFLTEAKEEWYHGSNYEISELTLDHLGSGTNIDQEGPGIYLTNNIDDAKRYGKYVHRVEAGINKSKLLKDSVKATNKRDMIERLIRHCPDQDDLLNWDENKSRAVYIAAKNIIDYSDNYRKALESIWYDFYRDNAKLFLSKVVAAGWQGFILPRADGISHFICWDPSILKIKEIIQ